MSNRSNDIGRAFEYACLLELERCISEYRPVCIRGSSSYKAAERAWQKADVEQREILVAGAKAFVGTLFEAEPLILECDGDKDVVELSVNKDSDAEGGDVRDIVISRGQISWDIGLSMKHNHFAAKHSRLSSSIDFGEKWYNLPCDNSYWSAVTPIFGKLSKLRRHGIAWNDIRDKENTVYVPLLNAFKNELERAYRQNPAISKRLVSYLLGVRDFYKVVAIDKKKITEIQSFNLRGELNKNGRHTKATIVIPIAELPDEILGVRFKPDSTNTIEVYFNNGWSLSFRIHNASRIVEPSLKFDVQFFGVPSNIVTIQSWWK